MMDVEFVTHASVLIRAGDVRLLMDPWIEGTAFDNGWALLSPPPKGLALFSESTHVWFSHEHPDHFSPPVLNKIPQDVRARLNVLLIETPDRKIAKFCQSKGFGTVNEITPHRWITIASGVSLIVGPSGDDSWCAVRADGQTLLNVNDCVLRSAESLEAILNLVGVPDVLLTQFSYAQWSGNAEDIDFRRSEGRRKLREIELQAKILHPKVIIPFASFVWFCHAENIYMNDAVNRIDDVAQFIQTNTSATPIVLYPGDVWSVGEPWDCSQAIERYLMDLSSTSSREAAVTSPATIEGLMTTASAYLQRAQQRNGALKVWLGGMIGLLPETRIWLGDLQRAVAMSVAGLRPTERQRDKCDVELSSGALDYMLTHDWGGNTLEVNGRYCKPPGGSYDRFRRWIVLGNDANHGRHLQISQIIRQALGRGQLRRVWRVLKGR